MSEIRKNTLSFIVGIFFILSNATSQWRIPADSVYQLIKTHSIYKSVVKWETIDANFENCLKATQDNEDIIKCLVKVFKQLNDVNSSLIYKGHRYFNTQLGKLDSLQIANPLYNLSKLEQNKIKTSLFKGKYAYIQLPGIEVPGNQINTMAQAIADSINKYSDTITKGFIVDLRLNTGGQLAAMLAGLHPLLGNGNIGGEIDENEKMLRSWKIESGNFMEQGVRKTTIKESSAKINQLPVVVLIGPITQNSGSMTAIAFKYRPKTYFAGESTANGNTFSNIKRQISVDLVLNLAEAYASDRKGHIYPNYVPPDIQIQDGDNFNNLMQDYKIRAAIRWFERNNFK